MSKYDVLTSIHKQFKQAAKEVCEHNCSTQNVGQKDTKNFKSCAQVESSVAPHVAHSVAHAVAPHSAGSFPRPQCRKSYTHGLRLREGEISLIRQKAHELNISVNTYIRAKALGDDYIAKPPAWLRDVLLKLYAELARQGNNLNQLARNVNMKLTTAENALNIADRYRQLVSRILHKLELAISGRRPPDDY